MIRYFDYVYYQIRNWYSRREGERETASQSAILALCLHQTTLILAVIFFINIFIEFSINKFYIIILCIIIISINFIRYSESKYEELNKKFKIKHKRYLTLLISLFSPILICVLFAYIKNLNWRTHLILVWLHSTHSATKVSRLWK